MYALPANARIEDIIRRSLICHPSLFSDALRDVARTHSQAAETMRHHVACATAERLALCARAMAEGIEAGDDIDVSILAWMTRGPDAWATALNVAARLQCLPPHMKAEAITNSGLV